MTQPALKNIEEKDMRTGEIMGILATPAGQLCLIPIIALALIFVIVPSLCAALLVVICGIVQAVLTIIERIFDKPK